MKRIFLLGIGCLIYMCAFPQYWQQRIKYVMDVELDVKSNIVKGKQTITYYNNSPDTLKRIFIHLFWNAFKPNSMMDVASLKTENLVLYKAVGGIDAKDFDRRFKKRIADLLPDERGSCEVREISMNGRPQKTILHETILEVIPDKPIAPLTSAIFKTDFVSKVPLLTRRSGRDSPEGIRFSMGQWYPKVSEYDKEGWHADDYVRGEFYGVWGDFDVNITLDKSYKVGATGELQNVAAIGWGYDKEGSELKGVQGSTRTWKFSAKNVHDFVWSADPEYKHITRKTTGGPLLHFIYKMDREEDLKWQALADTMAMIYPFMAKTFGVYPYPVYSFLHGGGGGTEYSLATQVNGPGVELGLHEWCHSWYQMMIATNENEYAWMDEGFASYMEAKVLAWLHKKDFFASAPEYDDYLNMAESRFNEPLSTPANYFSTNYAYNTNAYSKGAVFLRQLGYVVGERTLDSILLEYYRTWRFKHPDANDFIRVAEKVSGLQLQWYKEFMLNTTKTVNYAIDSLWEANGVSRIRLKRLGDMPMPIDLQLTFKDGSYEIHNIPLSLVFGLKKPEFLNTIEHGEWKWTHPTYVVEFKHKLIDLKRVDLDPTWRIADTDMKNNVMELNW